VHLGVLVDRPVDGDEQAGLVERTDVVVQVRVATRWRAAGLGAGGFRCGLALRLGHRVHERIPLGGSYLARASAASRIDGSVRAAGSNFAAMRPVLRQEIAQPAQLLEVDLDCRRG